MPEHPSDYYLLVNPSIKISRLNCCGRVSKRAKSATKRVKGKDEARG